MSDRPELALRLVQAVAAAHQAAQRATDRAFQAYGLSQRGHAALQAVDQAGSEGARPSAVAQELGVSRAAATTFIQRLETKGLVETSPDPDDDRSVRVALTRRGLEVLLRAGHLERRLAARTVEGLPASSLQRTIHLLDDLRRRCETKEIKLVP
jgi:MarR family transcriptional regulator, transcriptional regulator for hemolysin